MAQSRLARSSPLKLLQTLSDSLCGSFSSQDMQGQGSVRRTYGHTSSEAKAGATRPSVKPDGVHVAVRLLHQLAVYHWHRCGCEGAPPGDDAMAWRHHTTRLHTRLRSASYSLLELLQGARCCKIARSTRLTQPHGLVASSVALQNALHYGARKLIKLTEQAA